MTTSELLPDWREREEALTPDRSYIVQAPAGSGKTGLLVQRYLRLLAFVQRPESIVAMTFTRKAAAEMKARVSEALAGAGEDSPELNGFGQRTRELARAALVNDRKQDWGLLEDSGRMQIQTIDSLCASLVRQMPIVSEAGGLGQVVEDAGDLHRLAARRMLQHLTEGDSHAKELFRRVALHFDNDISRLESQIADMLAKRDQWMSRPVIKASPLVADFLALLELSVAELKEVFRQRSAVDFIEVTQAAITALGQPEAPSDLLYSLDYRIEHLLVDEFQDTSRAQYELLEGLTAQWSDGDGRTLFLVGDPVQSIYRFRAAEVALFLRAWNTRQLGSVRLQPLALKTNFRSTPEIVEWAQRHLAAVLSRENPEEGAVQLRPAVAARKEGGSSPKLIALLDDKGAEEAREIVRIIEKSPKSADIAILVRSRSHINSVLPALRSAGISYQAVEIDALKDQQHILDLLSLTRALMHLADRVSWLACLRAPWSGLTLHDLAILAEDEPQRTVFDLLNDPEKIARLSPDGRARAVRIGEILTNAVYAVGRVPVRDVVEQTWLALGGPAILTQLNHREDAQTFFDELEDFDEGGSIRDFSLLSDRLERLYAKPNMGESRVRVMTIHEAKGLEFDTVIIPKLGNRPLGEETELLSWTEITHADATVELDVAAEPQRGEEDVDYRRVRDELKEKNRHEAKRLFYVACTRARNHLYLVGSVKRKKGGGCCKAAETTFLGMIWPDFKQEFESLARRKQLVQANLFQIDKARPQTLLRRLPADWHAPRPAESVRWEPQLRRATASARQITYEWVSGTGRHVGTVVHEILKLVSQTGPDEWDSRRIAGMEGTIRSELLRLGVLDSDISAAADKVVQAVTAACHSERGRWIFAGHGEARSEWPIAGTIGDQLISGTIDRMFRDGEGKLWIIDFKTSEHEGANLERFLKEEGRRYREQLENYAALVSRLAEGPIWLGLYFPLLDAWLEWEFVEAYVTAL